jgi:hypothetical protein
MECGPVASCAAVRRRTGRDGLCVCVTATRAGTRLHASRLDSSARLSERLESRTSLDQDHSCYHCIVQCTPTPHYARARRVDYACAAWTDDPARAACGGRQAASVCAKRSNSRSRSRLEGLLELKNSYTFEYRYRNPN